MLCPDVKPGVSKWTVEMLPHLSQVTVSRQPAIELTKNGRVAIRGRKLLPTTEFPTCAGSPELQSVMAVAHPCNSITLNSDCYLLSLKCCKSEKRKMDSIAAVRKLLGALAKSSLFLADQSFAAEIAQSAVSLWAASAGAPKQLTKTKTDGDSRFAGHSTGAPDSSPCLIAAGACPLRTKQPAASPAIAPTTVRRTVKRSTNSFPLSPASGRQPDPMWHDPVIFRWKLSEGSASDEWSRRVPLVAGDLRDC